jgi:hypothetical protein
LFVIGRTACELQRPGFLAACRAVAQCLVVRPRTLARFANNPLALLRAAQAGGLLRTPVEMPARLEQLWLEGRTPVVDTSLLRQLRLYPGPEWMAALVQASLGASSAAVFGNPEAENLIAGVMSCLPPECRVEMSFSIGLRFSSRRPYRLVALPHDREEQQRMTRLYEVAMLDVSRPPPAELPPLGSWGRLIHRVLKTGRISFFTGQLARRPLDFSPRELPALALQFLEELDASDEEEEPWGPEVLADLAPRAQEPKLPIAEQSQQQCGAPSQPPAGEPLPENHDLRHAHAAHPPLFIGPEISATATKRSTPPSRQIEASNPAMLEKLERLDDLVFESISGNGDSLEQLKSFWPQVRGELEGHLLAESREQYLRYALASWEELAQRDGIRNPSVAMQSLEVLCVLFAHE